ncbi:hypothetical protein SAMN05428972_3369 [Rhodanobacter sp. OK091]|nr:hypothetical protein SAMN05428972_3369 [Rhodanobacter sp. OK091]
MGLIEGFTLGTLGGIVTELYGLYQLRKHAKAKRPDWLCSTFYWVTTGLMVVVGGGVVVLYVISGAVLNPWLAIHLGVATPALIGTLSKSAPNVDPAG